MAPVRTRHLTRTPTRTSQELPTGPTSTRASTGLTSMRARTGLMSMGARTGLMNMGARMRLGTGAIATPSMGSTVSTT